MAQDVLAGVAAEYLFNVGRTMRFLEDKYAKKMSPEEIILHTLFESGITEVADLDRYVQDDVVRHGVRMGELEKKLVNAYAEAVCHVVSTLRNLTLIQIPDFCSGRRGHGR